MALKCTEYENIEINSFDAVENGYDEPTIIQDENQNEEQNLDDNEGNEDDEEEK